jgi:acyl-CoA reductase-like NAD-dependent aldehyde dehydrogenase
VFNPANGEKLADVSNSGQADVKEAVLEAAQAFQSWKLRTAKVFVCYYCQIIRI